MLNYFIIFLLLSFDGYAVYRLSDGNVKATVAVLVGELIIVFFAGVLKKIRLSAISIDKMPRKYAEGVTDACESISNEFRTIRFTKLYVSTAPNCTRPTTAGWRSVIIPKAMVDGNDYALLRGVAAEAAVKMSMCEWPAKIILSLNLLMLVGLFGISHLAIQGSLFIIGLIILGMIGGGLVSIFLFSKSQSVLLKIGTGIVKGLFLLSTVVVDNIISRPTTYFSDNIIIQKNHGSDLMRYLLFLNDYDVFTRQLYSAPIETRIRRIENKTRSENGTWMV
ncbi:MAG: hypothetical protein IJ141_05580 [Lachnospiraceae bacterium]|nr:hypothetical protein [Lachnospiraceae bacterium]